MFWNVVINIGLALISYMLYKPPPGPKGLSAKDLSMPKSQEGAAIVDGAGTFWVSDSHSVWDGDFGKQSIYKRGGKK